MMKIKVDVKNGTLEIEGEDSLVKEIYSDFQDRVQTAKRSSVSTLQEYSAIEETHTPVNAVKSEEASRKKNRSSSAARESYEINKDLDVYGRSDKPALQAFYESKAPSSNLERNAVFVYYLKKALEKPGVTIGDIYTCYKAMNVPVPGALRQSVLDTSSSRYGWIDASDLDNIKIPIRGETFVEHALPKNRPAQTVQARAAAAENVA